MSTLYTEDVNKDLIFIDSRDQYIIAIEITESVNATFKYVLLQASLRNSSTLIEFKISS